MRRILPLVLLIGLVAGLPGGAQAQAPRILMLFPYSSAFPSSAVAGEAARKRLNERSPRKIELYSDFLDLDRFPGEAHELRTAHYLAEKYAQAPPDLVMTLGGAGLPFVLKYRALIAPKAPVVFCCLSSGTVAGMPLPDDVTGIVTDFDLGKTLELAQALQPGAKQVVFVGGASDLDRPWEQAARRQLGPYEGHYDIRYLIGLPFGAMLDELRGLPHDTIVLLGTYFMDRAGQTFVPHDVAERAAQASAAPVYAPFDTFLGTGIVGGYMDTFASVGTAAADLALQILGGKPAYMLPPRPSGAAASRIDARTLARWRIAEANVPEDAVVLFRAASLWEQHRNLVIVGAAVILLQTAMIFIVLMQSAKRRTAEQSLKESEERTAFAAASIHIGLWQRDAGREGLWSTEHCRAMFGIAADAPLTLDAMLAVVHPDDRDTFAKSMRAALNGGVPPWRDFRVAVGGQTSWISARAQPRYDDAGTLLRVSGVFADVSARKTAEVEIEEQRGELAHLTRVSLLGELSGAIAHEINQPLTAILANAQAGRRLLTGPEPDLAMLREVLDDIVQEDNRAGEVIRRLRSLLRKGERKSEPVDLNSLVAATLQLTHTELVARKTRVDALMFDDLLPVDGDPVQLQQVLLNLLINAADSMADASPVDRTINIATRSNGAFAEVVIGDRGHGIGAGQERLLFQPFFTTKPQGLGLGLSICATIVAAHGGELRLVNNPEGGATATLRLPTVAAPARVAPAASASALPAAAE